MTAKLVLHKESRDEVLVVCAFLASPMPVGFEVEREPLHICYSTSLCLGFIPRSNVY
jgi:hypothetical protein